MSVSGYPIRKPPGLSSLAALRGFSQLAASFFACRHQGIHHKPLGSSSEPRVAHFKSLREIKRTSFRMLDSCYLIVLYSWKLCFPQNCWSLPTVQVGKSVILPCGCQSAAFRQAGSRFREGFPFAKLRLIGLEPMTPRLSSACSNQLSYSRMLDLLGTMY